MCLWLKEQTVRTSLPTCISVASFPLSTFLPGPHPAQRQSQKHSLPGTEETARTVAGRPLPPEPACPSSDTSIWTHLPPWNFPTCPSRSQRNKRKVFAHGGFLRPAGSNSILLVLSALTPASSLSRWLSFSFRMHTLPGRLHSRCRKWKQSTCDCWCYQTDYVWSQFLKVVVVFNWGLFCFVCKSIVLLDIESLSKLDRFLRAYMEEISGAFPKLIWQ